MSDFRKGDTVLYTDPPNGHFVPDKFIATVVSAEGGKVDVDIGNDLTTTLIEDFCKKISKPEKFKLILEGVYNVKPTD